MKIIPTMLCATALIASAATPSLAAEMQTGTAALMNAEGKTMGTVEFRETPSGLMWVSVNAEGIPAGKHGFHIHETGACDAADGFSSAGGHLSGDADHGILAEGGPHPGDLPNVTVAGDGTLAAEFFVPRISDTQSWFDDTGLFDQDGSAVVMHKGADDYTTQPSGDAGDRLLCGDTVEKGRRHI